MLISFLGSCMVKSPKSNFMSMSKSSLKRQEIDRQELRISALTLNFLAFVGTSLTQALGFCI